MAPGRENRAPGLRHEVQVWGSLPEEGVTVFQAGGLHTKARRWERARASGDGGLLDPEERGRRPDGRGLVASPLALT